ncbi:lysylphosphatidylglycerol synthase domain-containing protein [Kordiimonas marina]|uniref:lysylphosphatidylglycerol synthase domain-containing protein n=1 Tax=Kordiimonas marina TaxID=2872312 RepID=UPI001FF10249|nr:lysylphosphatidylglycerol synthase domain-containing protein [Kordiimonas marina]MCJ9430788.1 lysylphosphatidylglycerol synthase domain-containing protein [Kordiimonas marina]
MTLPRKKLLSLVGSLLMLASFWFLYRVYEHHAAALMSWKHAADLLPVLALGAAFYMGIFLLVAECWHRMLAIKAPGTVGRRTNYASMMKAQVAKYLPGNVGHFVSRHLYLAPHGVSHSNLLKAMGLETSVCLGSGLLFTTLTALPGLDTLAEAFDPAMAPYVNLLAGAVILTAAALGYWIALPLARRLFGPFTLRDILIPIGLWFAFFGFLSAAFAACFTLVNGQPAPQLLPALFIASWTLGFVVPGAPGGLGVREAALVILFAPFAPTGDIMIAAILLRLMALAGEILSFFAGLILGRNKGQQ